LCIRCLKSLIVTDIQLGDDEILEGSEDQDDASVTPVVEPAPEPIKDEANGFWNSSSFAVSSKRKGRKSNKYADE